MSPSPNKAEKLLSRLTEIVNANITNEQFGVSELARQTGMSRSNLHRKVKSACGKSASQFIRDVRLDRALDLLREEEYTISEVAFKVGFGSTTYFNKCFRDRFGMTPGEYEELGFQQAATTEPVKQPTRALRKRRSHIKTPRVTLAVISAGLIILIAGGIPVYRTAKANWVRNKVLPEIQHNIESWNTIEAFRLAEIAEKYLPDDSVLIKMTWDFTCRVTILSDPPGAEVYLKEYSNPEEEWTMVGKTPIREIRMPIAFFRWKFQKPGYESVLAAMPTPWYIHDTLKRTLHNSSEIPPGMVYVEGLGDETDGEFLSEKQGFFMDRYEVTNQQFKKFMDAGGYTDNRYWRHSFEGNGDTLSWDQAMALFRDGTGRHGPAGWIAGDYPDGEGGYPVSGISWYEADAYAVFAGKELPTSAHWQSAAGLDIEEFDWRFASEIIPLSNIGGGSVQMTGRNPGLNCFGSYDIFGNVSEWCSNRSANGRIIRGGAWNDASYMSVDPAELPPLYRSNKTGFRCVSYINRDMIPEEAFQPIIQSAYSETTNHAGRTPVPDTVYRVYMNQFMYDPTPLEAQTVWIDSSHRAWTEEKIVFNAAYDNEQVVAHLFLPRNAEPPFQIVVYFPHAGAFRLPVFRSEDYMFKQDVEHFLRDGRAVLVPVLWGMYQRQSESAPGPFARKNNKIKRIKDIRRSLDYLETRPEIDPAKLCLFGVSIGAADGPVALAVDDRFETGIFLLAGLQASIPLPEIDPINYVSRIHKPVLMVNGKYDLLRPLETHVYPVFELLGTSPEDKALKLYDTHHYIPDNIKISESLGWLDRYFGPVHNK